MFLWFFFVIAPFDGCRHDFDSFFCQIGWTWKTTNWKHVLKSKESITNEWSDFISHGNEYIYEIIIASFNEREDVALLILLYLLFPFFFCPMQNHLRQYLIYFLIMYSVHNKNINHWDGLCVCLSFGKCHSCDIDCLSSEWLALLTFSFLVNSKAFNC